MWRTTMVSRVAGLALAVCLAAESPCSAGQPECRDGGCEPHCPVRPGQFGYYPTQWRRWPGAAPRTPTPGDSPTPAPPARSVVPGPEEESPPRPAATPAAAVEPAGGRALERLVAEADAARLSSPAARQEFSVRLVSAMLTEADPQSRCVVLGLAAGFDTPAAEAICTGALEDPDPRVRLSACEVCAERRGADGIADLARRAREDVDLGVRLRAVRTLGDVGGPAAVPHLLALLEDPDPAVRARAVTVLELTTGERFGADVDRWQAWAANPRIQPSRWSLGRAWGALRTLF